MKYLTSRWNREKAEAVEKARVFDVEERDECLILSKGLSAFQGQAIGSAVFALIWIVGNWHVYQSPINRNTWIGWVILWMLIGPAVAFFPIREAWRVHQGDVWIFNRSTGQLEHNGVAVFPLSQINSVQARSSDPERPPTLSVTRRYAKVVEIDTRGTHEEHLRVGQQIANFTGVRLNPPYW